MSFVRTKSFNYSQKILIQNLTIINKFIRNLKTITQVLIERSKIIMGVSITAICVIPDESKTSCRKFYRIRSNQAITTTWHLRKIKS